MKRIFLGLITLAVVACQDEPLTINGLTQTEAWEVIETERQAIKEEGLSKPCNDSSDWNFIGLGDKACGGFWEYIPYSTELNVAQFVDRVLDFNDLEAEYNNTFQVVSDCSAIAAPTAVNCNNGEPELVY